MPALGLDLSESASKALQVGVVHALPYLALILIVGATGFIQQRQIQGRNTGASVNPQQQMIMKIMPHLPAGDLLRAPPSGLVIYFAVSNLYRIGQQAFITRSIYGMKGGKRPEGSEPVEAAPQPSFREMFGSGQEERRPTRREQGCRQEEGARQERCAGPGDGQDVAQDVDQASTKTSTKTASKTAAKAAPAKTSSTKSSAKSFEQGLVVDQFALQPQHSEVVTDDIGQRWVEPTDAAAARRKNKKG